MFPNNEGDLNPFKHRLLPVAVASAVFFVLTLTASLVKSPVWDEPFHIAAGLSYVESGQIIVNEQHPPLLKELSGLFLRASGVRWPANAPPLDALRNGKVAEQTGISIISENGPDTVLFWSRLPMILMGTAMIFVLYTFGTELLGRAAALGAVLVYTLDPIMLGHSIFVTTDTGLALSVVLALLMLWRFLRKPGLLSLVWCGLALGAMLASKFSSIVMLPVGGLLLIGAAVDPIDGIAEPPPISRRLIHYALAALGMCAIAFGVLQYLYFFPVNVLQYRAGMDLVNADHNPNYLYYMAGQFQTRFYSYYLVAYLLKEPLAAILAAGVGLAAVVGNRSLPRLAIAFLLIPPVAMFVGYTLFSDNMGVRYLAPVLPFMHLLGGAGLAALVSDSHAWGKTLAVVLSLWLAVAAAGIYPDHLSYFNEAACLLDRPSQVGWDGGSRCGTAWLDDSNTDWAQGVKQLKTWLDANAQGRTVRVGYFGSFPTAVYGVNVGPQDVSDILNGPTPGLYAVSAQFLVRAHEPGPGHGNWLLTTQPKAIVGHSFYIYDIPAGPPGPAGVSGQ